MKDRVYRAVVAVGSGLLRVLDARPVVSGAEHLPAEGGFVLAVSHLSYLDFVMSQWALWRTRHRYTRFLATRVAFEHVLSRRLMSAMGHIAVDRRDGADAYRCAVDALRRGEVVGVFPEGRVSGSFTLLPFRTGAARMAAQSGRPVVPCVVWGSHRILTRTRSPRLRQARHVPVQVLFGPPVDVRPHDDPSVVTAALHGAMSGLLEQAMDADDLQPGAWWVPAHRGGAAPAPELA